MVEKWNWRGRVCSKKCSFNIVFLIPNEWTNNIKCVEIWNSDKTWSYLELESLVGSRGAYTLTKNGINWLHLRRWKVNNIHSNLKHSMVLPTMETYCFTSPLISCVGQEAWYPPKLAAGRPYQYLGNKVQFASGSSSDSWSHTAFAYLLRWVSFVI